MRTYKQVQETRDRLVSVTCDRCKKVYNDMMEYQEFLEFRNDAGYGSVMGDGNKLQADICQYCVRDLLGPFIRIVGNYISGGDFDQDLSFCDPTQTSVNATAIDYKEAE